MNINEEVTPRTSLDAPLELAGFPHPPISGKGLPTTIENVAYLMEGFGYSARFNVIKKQLEITHAGRTASMTELVSLANRHGLKDSLIAPFCNEIGFRNTSNPVRDWILSKPWDGVDRLEAICDTVTTPDAYPESLKVSLIFRWLLSATAAALSDGPFRARGVLTLQGAQGLGKTSWIASLVPAGAFRNEWIKLDHHMDGGNKDSIIAAIRHWIVEIGELDSSFKKDIARLKGFLTNNCDKLRPPYGREEVEYPRRTVFAATVNEETFLVDPTGNSRWWTIAVEKLDFRHEIEMQQLYAQCAFRLEQGMQWWLDSDEENRLAAYNLRHRSVSAITERIRDQIDMDAVAAGKATFKTATEVLAEIGVKNPTNAQCREAGQALRDLIGPPKRINGRDKWRVPLRSAGNYPPSIVVYEEGEVF